jgi:UDP-N-acetylglucosamine diphosphorylase / glucose-1-phosphate thymidylyltransferase / UDP-N-acetylgalactosamine diphosphorylase / glucosamine-1-phosphate N-acetyltransferase / galactosamine-1-phosphate N-acetyltransferase
MQQEDEIIDRLKNDGCKIISIDGITEGTASSVLHSRKLIDNDQPLLVANSDQYVDFDCFDFVKDCIDRDLDGSILVFKDLEKNPKWSFARLEDELVAEVAEKKAISDLATVGIYLFRRGSDFVGGAIDMIVSNDRVNDEFYTCPVYNYLISEGLKIGVYEIPKSSMNGLGTPSDLEDFLKKSS